MSGTEISSVLSKMWRECPLDIKKVYREREARDRETYKREMAAWKLNQNKSASIVSESASSSLASNVEDDSLSEEDSEPIDMLAEEEPLDLDYVMNMPTFGNKTPTIGKHGLDVQESVRVFDIKRVDTIGSSFMEPINEAIAMLPTSNWILAPTSEKLTLPGKRSFEDYSLDEILQSDELFEDFSPAEVKTLTPMTANNSLTSMFTW